ncbi:SpoIIE family protein phosphatase [Nocardia huaxiensis]|uniref:SpoIIE family protein phosphatase n=1 Tax=Nocardia huaxiensis TaxID=2755382 RepID=A0A7D6Z050_9NOCA|nr:SpoIIE family protein phosphatase [Nocardia huaxiensis]QLY29126.1 SpoIIE family protein phosphatase [Nocardia huaxiensis]UFS97381.1 SpoIIE family protein phosphatase [Nocardia huaxiensis]
MVDEGVDDELSRRVGDAAAVQQVFDQLPMIIAAMDGPEYRFVAATALERAYVGREHVIGMCVEDVFPEIMQQGIKPILDQVYASGESMRLRDWRVQVDLPDTGGRREVFADFDVHPRRSPDGTVVGVTCSLTDVTDQVHARQSAQRRAVEAERRFAHAQDTIDALQRILLPAGLPVLPRLRIAASYLLADTDMAAGGDWFDAVTLPGGRTALVVGDVVGHGVAAAATMGQLRILLHEHLLLTGDIAAALTALDAAAQRIPGAYAATVGVVLLDPETGALEYCTAGHPPPLVATIAGDARFLPATGAGPIGVGGRFTRDTIGSARLADAELILLYTDGILERPGRELAQSTVELAHAAADSAAGRAFPQDTGSPVERICSQTLEMLTRISGYRDDITLLAAQRSVPPEDLTLRAPALPASLGPVRKRLSAWLSDAHIVDPDAEALRHAAMELITNCIEHAYTGIAGHHTFTLTATVTENGIAEVRVMDEGRWRPPTPAPDRGLGLQLADSLVDSLHIAHDETGTSALLTHRLARPARLLTSTTAIWGSTARQESSSDMLLVFEQVGAPRPRVQADGPIDANTVAEFERTVRTAGSTGQRSLTVDLTGVTHLASAGIAALHRLSRLHHDNGTRVRWFAPTGSPSDVVLSLVRLDHHTHDPDGTAESVSG